MVRLLRSVCVGAGAALVLVFCMSVFLPSRRRIVTQQSGGGEAGDKERLGNRQLYPHPNAGGHSKKKLGYFFAMKYYEQQTQAAQNFLQLQCLATSYDMQVVEPFVLESQLGVPFIHLAQGKTLPKYGDIVDLNLWNKQAQGNYDFPAVVSWKDFLSSAPRNLVIVCMRHRDPPHIKIPNPGYNFRTGCGNRCYDNFNSSVAFLGKHGFKLVRKVCANFVDYAGSVTSDAFIQNILGTKYKSSEVTVILNQFRGFFGLYRMQVLSPCGLLTHTNINMSVLPSLRLVKEADEYSRLNFGEQPYVSIMVRTEKIVLHSHLDLLQCAESALSRLRLLKQERGLEHYFLAMDVGQYGSSGVNNKKLNPLGEQFFEKVYGDTWTFKKWEESFTRSSSSDNPAYIANLQRTVAAKGACLLMVGAGGFQAQARRLYDKYHPNISTQCVYKICAD